MYKEKFAKILKELIGDRSVTSIAKQIGMHHQTLQRYINCEREIAIENLVKIADYFGEDIDVLIGRKEY